MKKLLYLLLLITTSILLVSCAKDITNHTVKIYNNDTLINNYFVENGESFAESNLNGLIIDENFSYWSTTKNGVKYTFTLPITSDLELYAVYKDSLKPSNPNDININFSSIKYYQGYGLEDLIGQTLINKLNKRLYDGVSIKSYGSGLNSILREADTSPVTKKLWTIYDGISSFGNKEHVMPKSWYTGLPKYAKNKGDVHNLRVSKASTNSARSNYGYFDKTGGWELDKSAKRFYPGDDHKGDTARIFFYMMIMVKDALDFSNNNVKANLNNKGNEYRTVFESEGFAQLLKWHLEDPVDEFEIHRNEVLFGFQGNRNPFIDFPELVYLTWPEHYQLSK